MKGIFNVHRRNPTFLEERREKKINLLFDFALSERGEFSFRDNSKGGPGRQFPVSDKNKNNNEDAEDRMKKINLDFEILGAVAKRLGYDRKQAPRACC